MKSLAGFVKYVLIFIISAIVLLFAVLSLRLTGRPSSTPTFDVAQIQASTALALNTLVALTQAAISPVTQTPAPSPTPLPSLTPIALTTLPLYNPTSTGTVFQPVTPTSESTATPPMLPGTSTPATNVQASIDEQLAQADDIIKQSTQAGIAYNAPTSMRVDQATTIELLMNPSPLIQATQLATQVTGPGPVVTTNVEITPLTKAELLAHDPAAFTIQPLQDDPIQPIAENSTTRWAWAVTPHREGLQQLTLVISREVKYEGQDYWREVKTYEADIDVNVTWIQRLESLDWKWFAGILLTAIAIPAYWRWVDSRKKKSQKR